MYLNNLLGASIGRRRRLVIMQLEGLAGYPTSELLRLSDSATHRRLRSCFNSPLSFAQLNAELRRSLPDGLRELYWAASGASDEFSTAQTLRREAIR